MTWKRDGATRAGENSGASSFTLVALHLKMLEDQDVLTHADFGVRSHIYRVNDSPRAKALIKLLEACE
jgi:hypothetical protein